jgi:tRNA pseudouridine38-40 synthase
MIVQYDGTHFFGWQVQAKGRTVQGDIEAALQKIHHHQKITLNGSGRTDSGVHAMGQVASIKIDSSLTSEQLVKAINSSLEKDVRIMSCIEMDEDFHARFSAKERRYEYQTVTEETPFTHMRSWCLKYDVDYNILNDCAALIIGNHDFTTFCKANAEVEHKRCIVFDSQWEKTSTGFIYHVKANRFLQHMVRFLVGTMVEVGRGRMNIDDFKLFMVDVHPELSVVRAPAHGLYLAEVSYG